MKAEEILYNYDTDLYCDGPVYSESGYTSATVIKAMDEYAQERSIAFAEWTVIRYKTNFYNGTYMMCVKYGFELNRIYTIAELYDIFNNENQEK